METNQPNKHKKSSKFWPFVAILVAAIPAIKTLQAGNPLSFMIPNFLLFTPYRQTVKDMWPTLIKVDKSVIRAPMQIPIIDAADYTFEGMRAATDNWRHPAVIRGFFNGTAALEKWSSTDYLPSKIGDFVVPVVGDATYNTLQNQRLLLTFREAFLDILQNEKSKKYLFFPVNSRENFNHSEAGKAELLREKINDVVLNDLELSRIWNGFGTEKHKNYFGAQLVIGRGTNDSEESTGTGWHCAAGNNWFAQVIGKKRWYFMDPEHSAVMSPLRGGKVNMQTGNREMSKLHDHIPLRYSDIMAGDLLYNPDWEWHTIKNYEGVSVGVPIREVNITLSIRNNAQYTAIILINKALDYFNIDLGGYPPNA